MFRQGYRHRRPTWTAWQPPGKAQRPLPGLQQNGIFCRVGCFLANARQSSTSRNCLAPHPEAEQRGDQSAAEELTKARWLPVRMIPASTEHSQSEAGAGHTLEAAYKWPSRDLFLFRLEFSPILDPASVVLSSFWPGYVSGRKRVFPAPCSGGSRSALSSCSERTVRRGGPTVTRKPVRRAQVGIPLSRQAYRSTTALIMSASTLLPVGPLDGAQLGKAGTLTATSVVGGALLVGLGLI